MSRDCKRDGALTGQLDLRSNGFRIIRLDSAEGGVVLDRLLPDPDAVFEKAEIFKPGSRTHAGRIVVDGSSYFLKRYNDRGPWYRIRHIFKRSRAIGTWRINREFLLCGVSTTEPVLCLEERRFGLLRRSYLVTRFAEGSQRLRDLWPAYDQGTKREILVHIAEVLGKMHRHGLCHGDLKWDNILGSANCSTDLTLIDLDGSHAVKVALRHRARKDIRRFLRDLNKYEDNRSLIDEFTRTWEKYFLSCG